MNLLCGYIIYIVYIVETWTKSEVSRNRVGDCAAADDYIDEVLVNVAKMVVEQVLFYF